MAMSSFINYSIKVSLASFGCVASIFGANPAIAQITNGGFEDGFNGWETTGVTSIETSAFGSGPTQGTNQALLSTEGFFGSDSTPSFDIETFLGLEEGSLNTQLLGLEADDEFGVTAGAAIKQTFNATAGQKLSFDWNFLTNEFTPSENNDFSFVSLSSLSQLASTEFSPFFSSLTDFEQETGFKSFSFTIPVSGTYTLGLAAIDVRDDFVNSGLLVDNVKLSALPTSIPEPTSTLGLLAFFSFGASAISQRRKRKAINYSAFHLGRIQKKPHPAVLLPSP